MKILNKLLIENKDFHTLNVIAHSFLNAFLKIFLFKILNIF